MQGSTNSSFLEISIAPNNEEKERNKYFALYILKIVAIALAVISFLGAFLYHIVFCFPFALFVFTAFVISYFQGKTYNFYDYCFVMGSVRINIVQNNKKSKLFVDFDCNKILKAGNVNSAFYLENLSTKQYKEFKATQNELTEYDTVFLVQCAKEVKIVILQFNEQFLAKILGCSLLQNYDKEYLKLISNL